jgi:hypothetical protein
MELKMSSGEVFIIAAGLWSGEVFIIAAGLWAYSE